MSVVVGYLSPGDEASGFSKSLTDLRDWDRVKGSGFLGDGLDNVWRLHLQAGVNVARPRNMMVARFIHLEHRPEWLLMVDGDMAFTADALEVLMGSARPDRIVGGLCFAWGPDDRIIPTMFFRDDAGRHCPVDPDRFTVPDNTLVQVSGTGCAFLLVHRDALVAMAESMPATAHPWFRDDERRLPDGTPHWVSEDLWFCDRAAATGATVWVHTAVEVKHRKAVWLTRALYESDTTALERA